jgi:hypothetical protein
VYIMLEVYIFERTNLQDVAGRPQKYPIDTTATGRAIGRVWRVRSAEAAELFGTPGCG